MIVSRFGLHIAGGIPFLLQRSGTQNLISPHLEAPFQPRIQPRNSPCPHEIKLQDFSEAQLPELAQHFLPTPRQPDYKPAWVYDPDQTLDVDTLIRLACPAVNIPRPIWWRHAKEISPTYGLTDIGPLVWTSAGLHNVREANRHIELARAYNRKLVIIATDRLPLFDGIKQTEGCALDPSSPLELIGTGYLFRHMQDIQNGSHSL